MPNLESFFPYYGGKWREAVYYPLPKYDTIVEPFAGAAGYSCRFSHLKIRLYDVYPVVFGIWDWLIKADEKEVLSIPLEFDSVSDLKCCQEAKWLVGIWINPGCASPCRVRSKRSLGHLVTSPGATWSKRTRFRIASQLKHIRHWKVYNKSYEGIKFSGDATWFVDPPYNNKAGSHYRHSDIDYRHLGKWSLERQGQIIVCENEGADWLPFMSFKTVKGSTNKNKDSQYSKEVIYHRCDKKTGFDRVRRSGG